MNGLGRRTLGDAAAVGVRQRVTRRVVLLGFGGLALANLLGLVTPVAAEAYIWNGSSGSIGSVDPSAMNIPAVGYCSGSDIGKPQIMPFSRARVYAVAAYRNYDQTFYAQPVLERYVNGAWTSKATLGGAVGSWTSTTLPAYRGIPWIGPVSNVSVGYRETSFGGGWNVQPGHYRIRYEFRWYVGTTLLGWVRTYAQVEDLSWWGDRVSVTRGTLPTGAAFCSVF